MRHVAPWTPGYRQIAVVASALAADQQAEQVAVLVDQTTSFDECHTFPWLF
jgi:hypothetical protein